MTSQNITPERFEITNRDLREEFIRAVENGEHFIAQKPSGSDVELFDENYGFYLAKKIVPIRTDQKQILRAYAVAKLSTQMPKLGLREFYYILRQKPELVKYFDVRPEMLYGSILDHINLVEIIADVDRAVFTVSTNSKGYIFYPFSRNYGDPNRKVAFSEELVLETLREDDLRNCMCVITVEKEAAASRLISLGIPKLMNAAIVTVGGTFNRAVFRFTSKYADKFPFIFFTDGDVYGAKMQTLITMGSEASRHLDLRTRNSNIYLAGLYPSVGAALGLPNDVEEKRLSSNAEARKMFEHLMKFGLVDEEDLKTWMSDLTYELEALSPFAFSTKLKDEKGNPMPIGLAIYLTEFIRLKKIPPKPLPKDDVIDDFQEELKCTVRRKLYPRIDKRFLDEAIMMIENELTRIIENFQNEIRDAEFEKHLPEIEKFIEETDVGVLKKHLINQYCKSMEREIYDVGEVVDEVITEARTTVTFDEKLFAEIREDITKAIKELVEKVKPKIQQLLEKAQVESRVQLEKLEDIEVCDLYDKILEEIGAKPSDAQKIREALARRLGVKVDEGRNPRD
ncbi:MAG: hypothetical protein QW764_02920 [Desulfurococcaceae archaeon]